MVRTARSLVAVGILTAGLAACGDDQSLQTSSPSPEAIPSSTVPEAPPEPTADDLRAPTPETTAPGRVTPPPSTVVRSADVLELDHIDKILEGIDASSPAGRVCAAVVESTTALSVLLLTDDPDKSAPTLARLENFSQRFATPTEATRAPAEVERFMHGLVAQVDEARQMVGESRLSSADIMETLDLTRIEGFEVAQKFVEAEPGCEI